MWPNKKSQKLVNNQICGIDTKQYPLPAESSHLEDQGTLHHSKLFYCILFISNTQQNVFVTVHNSDILLCAKVQIWGQFYAQITIMLYHAPPSLENYICHFFKKYQKV
jgi:hypothetical protein